MSVVWQDAKEYREGPLLVLLALADWANDEGWCWPSVPAIAAKARLTERQVYNVLAGLQRDGVIVKKSGGGRGKATRYQVIVSALGRPRNPETISGFTGDENGVNPEADYRVSEAKNPEAKPVNPEIGDTKTLKLATSPYIEPSIEPSKAKSNTPLPPSQASGECAEGFDDVGDEEIADAVMDAIGVADGRVRRKLRGILLAVVRQERARSGCDGDELQELLVDAWVDYSRAMPRLRWAYASPAKFYGSPTWRQPESWPWLQGDPEEERRLARARVGLHEVAS